MQTVNISDFRANLLTYLEKANSGELISVTSSGKQLAMISLPLTKQEQAKQQLAALAANAKVHDVISPTDSEWDAML